MAAHRSPTAEEKKHAAVGVAVIVVILLMVVGCITNAARGDSPASTSAPTTTKPTAPLLAGAPSPAVDEPLVPGGEEVKVSRVIDGDTFELVDGRKVRLLGVDSCEMETYAGPQAQRMARTRIGGATVWLVREPTAPDTDRYGRLLRYVQYRHAGDVEDLGLELVQWDHTGIYTDSKGRQGGDASAEYLEQLRAADTEFSRNPPSGRECDDPFPPSATTGGDDDSGVYIDTDDDDDDDHHRESRFCRKRWWC